MKRILVILIALLPLFATAVIPQPANAIEQCDYRFYELNNISFYDPCDTTCTSRDSVETDRPEILNQDYKGRSILSSAQLATIREYTPTYQAAAKETQVPWQMIAALHFRENGLKKSNPANGFGVYQDTANLGGDYPAGSISDGEFLEQSTWAANQLKSKASKPDRLASGDIKQIKEAFFGYNNSSYTTSPAALYIDQAKALGFTDTQGYEGSPYVMNKIDSKRDPTAPTEAGKGQSWGEVMEDGGSLEYPANNEYGAFVVFAALSGIDQSGCSSGLKDGGMTLEEAKAFMQVYIDSPDSINYIGGAGGGAPVSRPDGPLANCTAFSNYFINKYTTKNNFSGSGWNLVTGYFLPNNPDVPSGVNAPEVYAVFSTPKSANHTGVILGIDVDAGTMIVGDQGYNKAFRYPKEVSIEWYQSRYGPMTYAYLGDFLKEDL